MSGPARVTPLLAAVAAIALSSVMADAAVRSGAEVYRAACTTCHGANGRGAPRDVVGFDVPLPDFTDCSFATREPDADWFAIVHDGGPVRAFSELMPALGDVLADEEIQAALDYARAFCAESGWPRGDLNLPRPLVTEKAFVEDEAVIEFAGTTEGLDALAWTIVYEQRIGRRGQFELMVPFGWEERPVSSGAVDTSWTSGVGDIALGYKHVLYASHARGTIVSATAEAILPTGDEDAGFGKGTAVIEPFVSFGQVLPADFFVQAQAGLELPLDRDRATEEGFFRVVLGRTWAVGAFGRAVSPMVELLGARELASGASTSWDVAPQVQVALNRRQNVLLSVGVRTPVTDRAERSSSVLLYVLWDWFDGGLLEGW